jgi:hypothetical protein
MSSIEGAGRKGVFENSRATGRTTRCADKCIQFLFEHGRCVISDHHPTHQASEILCGIILRRLGQEHQGVEFTVIKGMDVEIKLTNFKK